MTEIDENKINAAYMDLRNKGQSYVATLSDGPIHIDEWRRRELEKLRNAPPRSR